MFGFSRLTSGEIKKFCSVARLSLGSMQATVAEARHWSLQVFRAANAHNRLASPSQIQLQH
jgi:hypothetical protein